jgi:hypothetical protein
VDSVAAKTYTDAIQSFESTFQAKVVLPTGLEAQWFKDALGEYELEIGTTSYDEGTQTFPVTFQQYQINSIGYLMKLRWCERELSRVLQINNIIGKDVSLNGNGDTKRMTKEELLIEMARVKDLLDKQKTTCYS